MTTEKDMARLAGEPDMDDLIKITRSLPVILAVEQVRAFAGLVLGVLAPK